MELSEQELLSPLWLRLKAHYQAKLQTYRKQNDNDLDDEKTAKLRGRIAEVNAFLALESEKPEFKASPKYGY